MGNEKKNVDSLIRRRWQVGSSNIAISDHFRIGLDLLAIVCLDKVSDVKV